MYDFGHKSLVACKVDIEKKIIFQRCCTSTCLHFVLNSSMTLFLFCLILLSLNYLKQYLKYYLN